MGAVKDAILQKLKEQWKKAVEKQYLKEPDKVRNSDIDKNVADIMSNPTVKFACKRGGIVSEDIKKILTEIRDEVCGK